MRYLSFLLPLMLFACQEDPAAPAATGIVGTWDIVAANTQANHEIHPFFGGDTTYTTRLSTAIEPMDYSVTFGEAPNEIETQGTVTFSSVVTDNDGNRQERIDVSGGAMPPGATWELIGDRLFLIDPATGEEQENTVLLLDDRNLSFEYAYLDTLTTNFYSKYSGTYEFRRR